MRRKTERGAFTMVELLGVIGVIAVLLAILFPALVGASRKAKISQALSECSALDAALQSYYREYGVYPAIGSSPYDSGLESTSGGLEIDEDLVDILRGEINDQNPRRLTFMDIPPDQVDADGAFIDPWGESYRFMCDFDFNGTLEITLENGESLEMRRNVGVWSLGPGDDLEEGDIASWK
jgi:type II secretory pathway pseudopilin PulG